MQRCFDPSHATAKEPSLPAYLVHFREANLGLQNVPTEGWSVILHMIRLPGPTAKLAGKGGRHLAT